MFPHSTQANFGQTVTSNGAMSGGGEIIMPPDAENTTVSSAPIYEISTGTGAVSETDSLGGYTGGGAQCNLRLRLYFYLRYEVFGRQYR